MHLKLFRASLSLHRSIAPRSRIVQQHRLIEQFEPLNFFNGSLGGFGFVKDNESLAFRFEVRLGDEFDDIAVFREDLGESLF